MATRDEAKQAVLDRIEQLAPQANSAGLLRLAEAFAWVNSTGQPHGGQTVVEK